MEFIARATSLVGGTVALMRRMGSPSHQAFGTDPDIPEARKQGIMTLKMPVAEGWKDGHVPTCAPGLAVNAFASGLDHPRWIEVLPNGDVLVAESKEQAGPPRTLMDHAAQATMRRVKAIGKSANRVTLWRDADGDGTAEIREVFVENQNQPFGMALVGGQFYLGNTDGIRVFDYEELAGRDKTNLDIFWLKDDSLEDTENLPEPEVLASDIVENLGAALEQFRGIWEELEASGEVEE